MSLQFINAPVANGKTATLTFGQAMANVYGVLGGFSVSYGSSDHFVKTFQSEVTVSPDRGAGTMTVGGTAKLADDSGNTGGGSVWALGIGQTADDPTVFRTQTWRPNQDGQVSITIERQAAPVGRAWVFVRGFTLKFRGEDHHVKTIKIDAGNATVSAVTTARPSDGYDWTITFTPGLAMADASGTKQDDASVLELLVMAAPADTAPAA